MQVNTIYQGDALQILRTLPTETIDCCITSPPYWGLRDYGCEGQLGLEKTPEEYVANLVKVFAEVKRVLKRDGTLWLNLGDSYAGSWGNYAPGGIKGEQRIKTEQGRRWDRKAYKDTTRLPPTSKVIGLKPKDLVGIPWRTAFALQADGWWLRQDIIWHKPNPMPESVTDRCTKAHEYIFLLAKSRKYYFDNEAIREPIKPTTNGRVSVRPSGNTATRNKEHWGIPHEGKGNVERVYSEIKGANKRSVWTVTTKPFKEAHFATFPPDLITPCILTTKQEAIILDPFVGSGTTAYVAKKMGRKYVGIELNPKYVEIAETRISGLPLTLI